MKFEFQPPGSANTSSWAVGKITHAVTLVVCVRRLYRDVF